MRFLFTFLLLISFLPLSTFANSDTTKIPIGRKLFHDRIRDEQIRADKTDGHLDGIIKVSNNPDVNLQVTDALIRKPFNKIKAAQHNGRPVGIAQLVRIGVTFNVSIQIVEMQFEPIGTVKRHHGVSQLVSGRE